MAYLYGSLIFDSKRGVDHTSSYSNSICDVLVGQTRVFVVHSDMRYIAVYNKNLDGTIGTYIGLYDWRNADTYIDYICAYASSVPYAYAIYVENGKDYLVGWSSSHNALFSWEISATTHRPTGRTQYNVCPRSMASYGRGGWDGGRYVYFLNPSDLGVYRWDLTNKTTALEKVVNITSRQSLDSSYTGSGMLIRDGFMYHGDGSNESNGYLGCWDLATGNYNNGTFAGSGVWSSVPGMAAISGNNGTIAFSPLHPNLAYYFYYSSSIVRYINVYHANFEFAEVPASFHDQDLPVRFKLVTDYPTQLQGQYRVLVDNVQKEPASGYTALENMPFTKDITLSNSQFTSVKTYTVSVDYKISNDTSRVTRKDFKVVLYNNAPVINLTVTPSTIHDENVQMVAKITDDSPTDRIQYRVLVGGVEIVPWTSLAYSAPFEIRRTFTPDQFPIGTTQFKVEAKDSFKNSALTGSAIANLTKNNTKPTLSVDLKGRIIHISSTDAEGDPVRFRIFVNGIQVIPTAGWSILFPTPFETQYTIPRDRVMVNQVNTIRVEVQDSAGDVTSFEQAYTIGYGGLMFKDATGNFYTDDLGALIKLLDLGSIKAREASTPVQVWLENKLGYDVQSVTLTAIQGDLDPVTELVELSKQYDPFDGLSSITFDSPLAHGESISFFVRINALDGAVGGGRFKVRATAVPL